MHERMDGDDGGAVLAMSFELEQQNKTVHCVIKGGVPPQLAFLPNSHKIQNDLDREDFDLVIMFGCSSRDRCGLEKILSLDAPIVNIDHHPDNEFFGQVNIVDAAKSSVSELLYDCFKIFSWPMSREVATCLLTGIITDTGSFKHSNTAPSTLKAAAELMKHGALVDKIIRHTFQNKDPQILKAWGKAMENSYYDKDQKIIYAVMTAADLEAVGQLPAAAFEGFVETLNAVPEAKFAMFLRQDGNLIKGSLRSDSFKKVDVSKIAQTFGGGGHKQAAGFSVVGKLIKDEAGKWKVV